MKKLLDAAKYISRNLDIEECTLPESPATEDKWILSRLDKVLKQGTEEEMTSFALNEFCDFYVEFTKPRIYGECTSSSLDAQRTLCIVFGKISQKLSLLLPELWKMQEELPLFSYPDEEKEMEAVCRIIGAVRSIREEYSTPPSRRTDIFVLADNDKALENKTVFFEKFAAAKSIRITEKEADIPPKTICRNMGDISVFIPAEELFDKDKEEERLLKEKERLEAELERSRSIFENRTFLEKAPQSLVAEEKEKERHYKEQYEKTLLALTKLGVTEC